ncbi:caspase domain-containing protein [Aspergillus similis]
MSPTNRALLIGSSYDDLPGTENDVNAMTGVLEKYDFHAANVRTLCGADATRENILYAWEAMISETSGEDSVVIYYSGHGGMAEARARDRNTPIQAQDPRRIQFLVPYDYDPSLQEWRGILDSEISKLLLDTTRRTQNVTYILDCCHSARLGRKPRAHHAIPKALSMTDYDRMMLHVRQLRKESKLLENECWINPHVVRIAAAADRESAWQYQNAEGKHVGILTEKLDLLMTGNQKNQFSWRSVMAGVRALVENEFAADEKPQQPGSAGADTRVPFSTEVNWSKALVAEVRDKYIIIQGGHVHGISPGDSFVLTPLIPNRETEGERTLDSPQAITTVRQVKGFLALADPIPTARFPYTWALASPHLRRKRWPTLIPENQQHIETLLLNTGDLEVCKPGQEPVIEFRTQNRRNNGEVAVFARGVQIGSKEVDSSSDWAQLFAIAKLFAQAQDLLAIGKGTGDEQLASNLDIVIGVVRDWNEEQKVSYSTSARTRTTDMHLMADDGYYIRLENKGSSTIYVSVLRVDATGKVTRVSRAWERGVELSKEIPRKVLAGSDFPLEGITLGWPRAVPMDGAIKEDFLFLITSEEVDLGFLETATPHDYFIARARAQGPETAARRTAIPYDVARIHYRLHPPTQKMKAESSIPVEGTNATPQRAITLAELPQADTTKEWETITSDLQEITAATSKGLIGAAIRTMKRIPPYVWVINEHDQDITVVVSQYRPTRLLAGGGLTLSPTGAGLNFETTAFTSPATTKRLAPQATDPEACMAAFPLWTRKDGFGVVSVFLGSEKELFIENDMVPIGAKVYFRGKPGLKVVEFNERDRC